MSRHLICPYCNFTQGEERFLEWLSTMREEDEIYHICENCDKETSIEIVLYKKEKIK